METVLMNKTTFKKISGRWVMIETTEENLTSQQVLWCCSKNTIKWFRGLGGTERLSRIYTKNGYKPQKLTSVSPDAKTKVIRTFVWQD